MTAESSAHTPLTREEIAGVEFDWFAADRTGQVAQFLAAGDDTVPAAALRSEELLEAVHVWIDTRPAAEAPNAPAGGFDDHLTGPQERGAFVYDWVQGQPGVYRLVAAPRHPLAVTDLPDHLREYLAPLTLAVTFGAPKVQIGPQGEA
ncbi:hypothetical protein GO986_14865 [Deinococcus sp. HMF7620]|uniref:Uncharacterized protein n=1 Tax=Deinococcus arboris TaxID=2682977 RepID=A0A7C9HSR4_9DEIO|nr:hypothetical protein [Deinococcus arboris]